MLWPRSDSIVRAGRPAEFIYLAGKGSNCTCKIGMLHCAGAVSADSVHHPGCVVLLLYCVSSWLSRSGCVVHHVIEMVGV